MFRASGQFGVDGRRQLVSGSWSGVSAGDSPSGAAIRTHLFGQVACLGPSGASNDWTNDVFFGQCRPFDSGKRDEGRSQES